MSIEEQLSELIDRRTFFVSTNGTGQGKRLYRHRDEGTRTAQVNGHDVTVERLYDLHEEFGPSWAYALWRIALENRASDILENEIGEWETRSIQGCEKEVKFPSGDWVKWMDAWENACMWAHDRLKKEGYDVPETLLF